METAIFWPLQSNIIRAGKTNNTFGMVRKNGDGTAKPHQGWDFAASVGTPAYAIGNGVVEFVRDKGDYGLQVCLAFDFNGEKLYAFYAHLNKSYVKQGDDVKGNDLIVICGKSGNAANLPKAEDHLHFEIRTKATPGLGLKDRVSPIMVFKKCPLTIAIPG